MGVALVTGAGRGIGRAIAEALAQEGHHVALVARSQNELTETKEFLERSYGVRTIVCAGDVGDGDFMSRAVHRSEEELGALEILVSNAGVYRTGSAEMSLEEFDEVMRTNVRGVFNGIHAAVPLMKSRKKGYLITVSSMCGVQGFPGVGGYCASKHALQGLHESLYRELVPLGLRVTTLLPSWVNTVMSASGPMPDHAKIQASDLGNAVRFLLHLSPGACIKELVIDCSATPI
jgi:3-oxoacyl-[acyl-carrier protein] reductase